MKLKLKLDDSHTREVWQAVQRAKAEVAAWPAWKRGETPTTRGEGGETMSHETARTESRNAVVLFAERVASKLEDYAYYLCANHPSNEGVFVANVIRDISMMIRESKP